MKINPLEKLNIWRQSLVGQLLLRFWVCHIIFFTLIGAIQYTSLKNSLYQSVEQNLLSDYYAIRNSMGSWLSSSEFPPGRFSELRPGNFVAFYTSDHQLKSIVYSYGKANSTVPNLSHSQLQFDLAEKARSGGCFVFQDTDEQQYMLMVAPVVTNQLSVNSLPLEQNNDIHPYVGYALIGQPLAEQDLILSRNLRGYIFNAIIIILLSTFFTALVLQKPLEPLLNISSTARKIAAGRYDLRLPYMNKTASEIQQLREALNHMLGQIENALNTERSAKNRMARFIADASHELRTPLTSIRGFLEILQRTGTADKETLDAAHQTMLIETERLIRLTEGLLTLNRIAQEEINSDHSEELNSGLHDVLPELMPLLIPLLKDRTFRFNGQDFRTIDDFVSEVLDTSQVLPLKPDELKQILYNLVNNAIQHTLSGGTIDILAKSENSRFILSVRDNGEGIPAEDVPHIFERFFQGDRSRSHGKGQGSGLGLAIVSELVYLRGGEIRVESTPGEGTSFTIFFPLVLVKNDSLMTQND